MKEFEWTFRLLICLFEVFLFYNFFKNIFLYKEENNKKRILLMGMLVLSMVLVNSLDKSIFNLFLIPILYLTAHCLLYQTSWKMHIFYVVIFYIVSAGIEIGVSLLFGIVSDLQIMSREQGQYSEIFLVFIGKIMTFLALRLVKMFLAKVAYAVDQKLLRLVFILPVSSLMLYSGFLYSELNMESLSPAKLIMVAGCFLLLFSNVFVFFLFEKLSYTMSQSSEWKLFSLKQGMEEAHYKILEETNQEHREYIHNMQHYLKTIGALAGKNQNEEIIKVIEEMNGVILEIDEKIYCNHSILNAIFSERGSEAKKLGIPFEVYIEPNLNLSFVTDFDWIAMVGNLLDNAIEAVKECRENKFLTVHMFGTAENHFIMLRIENSFAVQPRRKGNAFLTSKTGKGQHGIGIENVRSLVGKYGGFLHTEAEGEHFIAALHIPEHRNFCANDC